MEAIKKPDTAPLPSRSVPFFNYPALFSAHENEYTEIILDVCRRGAFILQKELQAFEENLAAFADVKHAIGVANATDGLYIALRALNIGAGDEVIFCSHTFIATAGAIVTTGATPVPIECGDDHLMDPDAIEAAITKNTKAIMPTQLNGRVCDMKRIKEVADRHGLIILEDAAQALGAKFGGQQAGSFGAASAISFYPAKSLGCFGDGGAILTNDSQLYDRMLLLRDHGRNSAGHVVTWGINSRLDNLQAALLDFNLKTFPEIIRRRREIAGVYHSLLAGIPELELPPPPVDGDVHFDTFQNYEIEAERRDELKQYLQTRGIGTLIQWSGQAVHQWNGLGFSQQLPKTERLFTRCLMLPMNMSLSDEDLSYVAQCVKDFYEYE